MALPFTTIEDLQTDLASKPGIYATSDVDQVNAIEGFTIHDQKVIREFVDKDGTSRYEVAVQQVIQDTSDNSYGYGSNRQWGDFDKSITTFSDEVQTHADGFEGNPYNGNTIIKITVDSIDEQRKAAVATGYLDNGATVRALFYKDDQDAWQTKVLS